MPLRFAMYILRLHGVHYRTLFTPTPISWRLDVRSRRIDGADLWFVTLDGGQKLRDHAADPHINLSYYKDHTPSEPQPVVLYEVVKDF